MAVLTFHWKTSTEERAVDLNEMGKLLSTRLLNHSDEKLRSNPTNPLDDPPVLDDHVGKYSLVDMITQRGSRL